MTVYFNPELLKYNPDTEKHRAGNEEKLQRLNSGETFSLKANDGNFDPFKSSVKLQNGGFFPLQKLLQAANVRLSNKNANANQVEDFLETTFGEQFVRSERQSKPHSEAREERPRDKRRDDRRVDNVRTEEKTTVQSDGGYTKTTTFSNDDGQPVMQLGLQFIPYSAPAQPVSQFAPDFLANIKSWLETAEPFWVLVESLETTNYQVDWQTAMVMILHPDLNAEPEQVALMAVLEAGEYTDAQEFLAHDVEALQAQLKELFPQFVALIESFDEIELPQPVVVEEAKTQPPQIKQTRSMVFMGQDVGLVWVTGKIEDDGETLFTHSAQVVDERGNVAYLRNVYFDNTGQEIEAFVSAKDFLHWLTTEFPHNFVAWVDNPSEAGYWMEVIIDEQGGWYGQKYLYGCFPDDLASLSLLTSIPEIGMTGHWMVHEKILKQMLTADAHS